MSGLGVLQRGDTVDIFASMTIEITQQSLRLLQALPRSSKKRSNAFSPRCFTTGADRGDRG
jgi:hypothetical protein